MNKLASIFLLQSLNLPTIWPNIIQGRGEKQVRKNVDSFYYDYAPGWVLRCGKSASREGKVERGLPWGLVHNKEELVRKILAFQKEIGEGYLVFCHLTNDMVRGGIMLVEGSKVVVESATGDPSELSAFYRGYRDPEQRIVFNPGMFSHEKYGGDVLRTSDLLDIRNIERTLNWTDLNAVSDPVCVEFSWLRQGQLYVHDVSVVS